MEIKIKGDEVVFGDSDEGFFSKLLAGCKGNVNIKTRFGNKKLKKVTKFSKKNEK